MRTASLVLLGLGGLFLVLEVVYGYQFGVWRDLAQFWGGKVLFAPTKSGEMALFGFLAIALPLLACPLAILSRQGDQPRG